MAARVYILHVSVLRALPGPGATVPPAGRIIEIRGDQTLKDLNAAIFTAYDRWDRYLTEFLFQDGPLDRGGLRYDDESSGGVPDPFNSGEPVAAGTSLDSLALRVGRPFCYWFNLWDDWCHWIEVIAVRRAEPQVKYPRVITRVSVPLGTAG